MLLTVSDRDLRTPLFAEGLFKEMSLALQNEEVTFIAGSWVQLDTSFHHDTELSDLIKISFKYSHSISSPENWSSITVSGKEY